LKYYLSGYEAPGLKFTKGTLDDEYGVCSDYKKAYELGDKRVYEWMREYCP
jgi:hypothetical protein